MLIPPRREDGGVEKRPNTTMNVIVFGSGAGLNLKALIRQQKKWKNPLFKIVAVFSEKQCPFLEVAKSENIPTLHLCIADYFQQHNCSDIKNPELRARYEEEVIKMLDGLGVPIDMVLLANYMRLLHSPLLQYFKNKIINLHPADLSSCTVNGVRRYDGPNSVYKALCAGEPRTRSTVHLLNEDGKSGPILVSGPWVTYQGTYPITQEKADCHYEKQKKLSDWPAVTEAVEFISQGRLSSAPDGSIYLDDELMPKSGVLL